MPEKVFKDPADAVVSRLQAHVHSKPNSDMKQSTSSVIIHEGVNNLFDVSGSVMLMCTLTLT